jgi:FkbM family methyltransferase
MLTRLLLDARHVAKRVLDGHPVSYRLARRMFVALRHMSDRIVFRAHYPRCLWRDYSAAALAQMKLQGYHSQYGQDYFLWSQVFRGKTDGFFVDIGCNHPVHLSNSLWFEQQGWHGVAFDPVPKFQQAWQTSRRTDFHPVAIGRSAPARRFIEIHAREGWEAALSGFAECVRPEDMRMYGFTEHIVKSSPLGDFVPPGQEINLLMIDAEGAEDEILRGIDLSRLRPHWIMVENVSKVGGDPQLRSFLDEQGYVLRARIGAADDVFCDGRRAPVS